MYLRSCLAVAETATDQMEALHDVVKAGYARYIGMSSCYAYQCAYLLVDVHKSLTQVVV
jgi:aryl-alcohol dehydrogenase-like predicted oxidoreductase